MSYPKIILNKRARRLFFGFLVLIFFVSTPILVMYTIGYRYDWQTNRILETGVISIDAEPRDANVFLSNVHITKRLPFRLTNRAPGTYNLRIEKTGYKTWSKNIDVSSKQTTYIKNISLLKDALPVPVFSNNERDIKEIKSSPDGSYIIIISAKDNIEIIELFNTQTKEIHTISRLPLSIKSNTQWSPFDNSILITAQRKDAISLTVISASNPDAPKAYSITKDSGENYFQWQKDAPTPTLFTRDGNYLIKLTLNERKNIHSIKKTDKWYIDTKEKLWLYKDNIISLKSSNDPRDSIAITNNQSIKKIIDINEQRIILLADKNIFIIPRDSDDQLESINATSFVFNPATKEYIVWSPWELWSIYEHNQPALLNRTSDNMISVFPLDDVGALLVANSDKLIAFNPGYYISQELFYGEIKSASVNHKTKTIYFLGKVGEKEDLFELEY